VIDFNYEQPVFGRGSGIFLHVSHHSPTAGMRPGVRILIGPSRRLRSLKAL
jgi:hypothetical protein